MRCAARQPLLSPAAPATGALAAALAAVLLAGCGGGATGAAGVPSVAPVPAAEPTSAPVSTDGPEGQGALADEPAYLDELDEPPAAWPAPGSPAPGEYVLAAGDAVPVPFELPSDALGGLAEVGVVMPEQGATTLTCDLGATGSVALRLDAAGAWTVAQTSSTGVTELDGGQLDPGQRGEPGELTALRLLCSSAPDGLAVAVSLHGAGLSFVEPVLREAPPTAPEWTVASSGTSVVTLDTVVVTVVDG